MMNSDIKISASILSADITRLGEEIKNAEAGGIDWIHVDVMDGVFVPNISMGPFVVEGCRRISALPIDVHLMIQNPSRHIAAFAKAGASNLSVHIEDNPNIHRTLQEIHALGCQASIVLNPGTPASTLGAVLRSVDMVLVMTVNPGFSGQSFLNETLDKIKEIRAMLDKENPRAIIQVDGGISAETAPLVYQAGARSFVAGHGIFRHPGGSAAAVRELRNAAR